ncbi:MAG: response regulator transcription factor [Acidobacteriota bacterium]
MTSEGESMDPVTIVLIDDHAVVRRGARAFLETQAGLEVIGEAESGERGVELVRDLAPDVALVDLLMPGMDGVEATRRMKELSPSTRVIVLTSYHDDEHVFPAIRAGALSYLLKEVSPEELAEAVRRAALGEAVLHPRVASRVINELHGARESQAGPSMELTSRELEVLRLIADGLNNVDLAERLGISPRTVKRHVSNILGKLHLADRTQAAVHAWREGLVRRDESP